MATSGPRRCNICNVLASSCAPFPTVSLLAQPRKEEGGRPRDCNLSTTDRAENKKSGPSHMDGYNHNPRAGKKRIFGQSSCFRGGVIDLAFALTFQITKCICQNCQVYLLKLPHVFVHCPILGGTETGLQLKAAPRPTDPIPSSSSAGF